MKVQWIPADPAQEIEMREVPDWNLETNGAHDQLQALQALVATTPPGSAVSSTVFVEVVNTPALFEHKNQMLVNDDGMGLGLMFNPRAREISKYPGLILGDVVIIGFIRDPMEGDVWTDVNEMNDPRGFEELQNG